MKRDSISIKILKGLLVAGTICLAASSPYFIFHLSRNLSRALKTGRFNRQKDPGFDNAFYYLKRKGYLNIKKSNRQIYISLTPAGRKRAKKYLIDDLKISKAKVWDGTWRMVIFDIPNIHYLKREAFRGKLKELGFYKLQQSVWVYPYECRKEIELLRKFFGLSSRELILTNSKIDNDNYLRKFFGI